MHRAVPHLFGPDAMTSNEGLIHRPHVSVVIPAYEAARFIAAALDSLLAQTFVDWEAIVVDDASSDDTSAVVAAHAARDSRIRLLRQEENAGPAAARNRAVEAARGDWIALLDADDLYLPERLERLIRLGETEGLDVVADNLWMRDPASGRIVRSGLPQDGRVRDWTLAVLLANDRPARGFVYGLLKPIVRADFLQRTGLRWRTDLRYGEDFVFYAELFILGAKAKILPEPFYVYVLPISETDGTRSPNSRTSMREHELIRTGDVLLAAWGNRLGPAEKRAIALRRTYLEHVGKARAFKALVFSGDRLAALRAVIETPFLLRFLAWGVWWRLWAKFSGRFAGPTDDARGTP